MTLCSPARIAILLAAGVAVTGCTVNPAPVVTTILPLREPVGSVQLAEPQADQPDTPLRERFARELETSLAAQGAELTANGRLIAEYSISAQPSNFALSEPETQERPGRQASQLNRKPRWWDKCKVEKRRGSLALFNRESGELSAKSEGEYFACTGDMSGVADMAALLVEGALAKR